MAFLFQQMTAQDSSLQRTTALLPASSRMSSLTATVIKTQVRWVSYQGFPRKWVSGGTKGHIVLSTSVCLLQCQWREFCQLWSLKASEWTLYRRPHAGQCQTSKLEARFMHWRHVLLISTALTLSLWSAYTLHKFSQMQQCVERVCVGIPNCTMTNRSLRASVVGYNFLSEGKLKVWIGLKGWAVIERHTPNTQHMCIATQALEQGPPNGSPWVKSGTWSNLVHGGPFFMARHGPEMTILNIQSLTHHTFTQQLLLTVSSSLSSNVWKVAFIWIQFTDCFMVMRKKQDTVMI